MFKLGQSAHGHWRRLRGHQEITPLLDGKNFVDGIQQAAAKPNTPEHEIGQYHFWLVSIP